MNKHMKQILSPIVFGKRTSFSTAAVCMSATSVDINSFVARCGSVHAKSSRLVRTDEEYNQIDPEGSISAEKSNI